MNVALALGALLAIGCVVLVALPYLREPAATEDTLDRPGELERRQLDLSETRDRALAALKELEFDHRTGKVSDEDYRKLVGPLRREAAESLRALEPRTSGARADVGVNADPPGYQWAMEPMDPTQQPQPPQTPEPYPPPGEFDPPAPPQVPEPYPPPGELDPPVQPQIPEPGPR